MKCKDDAIYCYYCKFYKEVGFSVYCDRVCAKHFEWNCSHSHRWKDYGDPELLNQFNDCVEYEDGIQIKIIKFLSKMVFWK